MDFVAVFARPLRYTKYEHPYVATALSILHSGICACLRRLIRAWTHLQECSCESGGHVGLF